MPQYLGVIGTDGKIRDVSDSNGYPVILTGSFVAEESIAENITILAGATWVSPNFYDCKMSRIGAALQIESATARKGKLILQFYDSTGNNTGAFATLTDFSSTAAKAASGAAQTAGIRVKVVITNSDTTDWTFANLDLFHTGG